MRKRKLRFRGMNPVQQRSIGVSPSQGGFFSVPQDERNYGQQSGLPMDQQLNMNHSNFGANTSSSTWSGAQTNVGPQDRVFAGSYASGCGYSNMNHMNMNHSDFGGNTAASTWSGAQTNVGPQDRVFAGSYASGSQGPYSNFVPCYNDLCCRNKAVGHCGGLSNVNDWGVASGGEGCDFNCVNALTTGGGTMMPEKAPQKAITTRRGGGRGGSMRRTSAKQMNMAGRRRIYQVRR
jgi:hypothetical protein